MSIDRILLQLLGSEAAAAVRAVAEAIDVAESVQHERRIGVLSKSDASPATVADFAIQALLADRLASAFPDLPLVAEEDASHLRGNTATELQAQVVEVVRRWQPGIDAAAVLEAIDRGRGLPGQRYWTLDPIDGTKGFLRRRQYAVALALIQDGRVVIGILGCPHVSLRTASIDRPPGGREEAGLAIAVRGRGAWWVLPRAKEITRLGVSGVADPSNARVLHSCEMAHSDVSRFERMLHALGTRFEPVLLDSQVKHVVVAAHRADLLVRFPTTPHFRDAVWDHAAGTLLISEAGGQVTDLAGQRLDFSTGRRLQRNTGLLASNGWLHDAALEAIAASRAAAPVGSAS